VAKTKTVWVAYTNTDCTEGRGFDVPIAVCAQEATAQRLAKNRYVQGSDGPVREMQLVRIDGKWYAPSAAINVIDPTREDVLAQQRLDASRAAIQRARDAGLTGAEIAALKGAAPCLR